MIKTEIMRTIYRDAVSGKIVTAKYAKANPDTTVKETMKRVPHTALEVLRKYNDWRRDDTGEIQQPDPKAVGFAIEDILNYFEK